MTIGNRIAELRKAKGFTQEYVAEQLGVSRQAVSKWEKDQSTPDTNNLIALSSLLDATVEYITVGTHNASTNASAKNETQDKWIHLHNTLITVTTFVMLFGILLTILFPYIGIIFIVIAVIMIIVVMTLESTCN